MKILFITDLYPIVAGENNSPKTLHNFVFEWIKLGHCVDVVKPNFLFNSFLRGKCFYPYGVYENEGVKIFNLNYITPFFFNVTQKLPKGLDVVSYDIIVAHMPSGIIFANKLAKKYNKPLVCGVHCSDLEVLKNPLYKFYFKNEMIEAYKNAKKIACRSFVLQQKFIEIFPELAEKTFVASSGVALPSRPSPFTLHPSPLTIIACANLIKRKNIDKLILAVNEVDGVELHVVGGGNELNKLKKLASSRVKFLGKLPPAKVLEAMREYEIFILPSINETFGMVYLEAMASGCVVVCTKNDGIDGIIIDGENGFLTEPTVEGIKKTILKIKSVDSLEAIRANSMETVKNYTPGSCAKNYLDNIQ